MPIYEYQCKQCGHKFEQLQKITDKPLRVCPKCNKSQLTKLISNTSFQLKGTGWYATDFKDKTGEIKNSGTNHNLASKKKETKPVETQKSKEKK